MPFGKPHPHRREKLKIEGCCAVKLRNNPQSLTPFPIWMLLAKPFSANKFAAKAAKPTFVG
jgi:hypothetical protein